MGWALCFVAMVLSALMSYSHCVSAIGSSVRNGRWAHPAQCPALLSFLFLHWESLTGSLHYQNFSWVCQSPDKICDIFLVCFCLFRYLSVKMTGIKKFKSPDSQRTVLSLEYIDDWAALFELLMCDSVVPPARKDNERRLEWGAHPGSARAVCYWDIFRKLEQLDSTSVGRMISLCKTALKTA
jgi:hypothetical protein